jgi:hypothetical protein
MSDPAQREDTKSPIPPRVHSHTSLTCSPRCDRDPTNGRSPSEVSCTDPLHPCSCPDSRRSPTPHEHTPHAGTARVCTPSQARSAYAGNTVFCICQPCARDSGNKIAASAHGMGSGGLAVDAMVIGCLGVDHRGERFFVLLHFCDHSTRN